MDSNYIWTLFLFLIYIHTSTLTVGQTILKPGDVWLERGDNTQLRCEDTSGISRTFLWYDAAANVPVYSGSTKSPDPKYTNFNLETTADSVSVLSITGTEIEDDGEYQCLVFGLTETFDASVTVEVKSTVTLILPDTVEEDVEATFECNAIGGRPLETISFYVIAKYGAETGPLSGVSSTSTPNTDTGLTDTTATLTYTPSRDDQTLSCRITGHQVADLNQQQNEFMNVSFTVGETIDGPDDVWVERGNDTQLRCEDTSGTSRLFTWFDVATSVYSGTTKSPDPKYTNFNLETSAASLSVLSINGIEIEDEGEYQCQLFGVAASFGATVTVEVRSNVTLTLPGSVEENVEATFECNATGGRPLETISFYVIATYGAETGPLSGVSTTSTPNTDTDLTDTTATLTYTPTRDDQIMSCRISGHQLADLNQQQNEFMNVSYRPVNTPALVGGVCGGLAVIILTVVLVLLYKKGYFDECGSGGKDPPPSSGNKEKGTTPMPEPKS